MEAVANRESTVCIIYSFLLLFFRLTEFIYFVLKSNVYIHFIFRHLFLPMYHTMPSAINKSNAQTKIDIWYLWL